MSNEYDNDNYDNKQLNLDFLCSAIQKVTLLLGTIFILYIMFALRFSWPPFSR